MLASCCTREWVRKNKLGVSQETEQKCKTMREQQDKNSSGTRKLKCSNEMWKFEFFGDLCFILLTSPAKRIIFGSVKAAEVVKMLPHFWVVKGTKVGIKNFQRLWNWTTFYLGRDTYLPTYLFVAIWSIWARDILYRMSFFWLMVWTPKPWSHIFAFLSVNIDYKRHKTLGLFKEPFWADHNL